MTEITARGQVLKNADDALSRIARNPMEVMTKVRVNAVASAIRKVWSTWWGELDPVIRSYTDQPKGTPAGIDRSHERWADFCADEEATDLLSQELVVEIVPLRLSEIVKAEERADRKGKDFDLDAAGLDLLMGLGVIVDDVSDAEDEAEPEKPVKKRKAKATKV